MGFNSRKSKQVSRHADLLKRKLKLWLILFFLALATPISILTYRSYQQLEIETYFQKRAISEVVIQRMDELLLRFFAVEDERPIEQYSFYNVKVNRYSNYLQKSPLAAFPPKKRIPGMIGYFQIGPNGEFSTPYLPAFPHTTGQLLRFGITLSEYKDRLLLQKKIFSLLELNDLVSEKSRESIAQQNQGRKAPKNAGLLFEDSPGAPEEKAENPLGNVISKRLSIYATTQRSKDHKISKLVIKESGGSSQLSDLNLDKSLIEGSPQEEYEKSQKVPKKKMAMLKPQRKKRKVKGSLPETRRMHPKRRVRVSTFEGEIDPLQFARLETGQFIFYRKSWKNQKRFIQGFLINAEDFLVNTIQPVFESSSLAKASSLIVADINGDILSQYLPATDSFRRDVPEKVLMRGNLSDPLRRLELLITTKDLKGGPGLRLIQTLTVLIGLILVLGFWGIFRVGVRQIELNQQQRNFVSSVSHELKTPLTSIRMYGEMLRSGWASEEKKKSYYDFIFHESERLTRLISNVLMLAKLDQKTTDEELVALKSIRPSELLRSASQKVSTQIENAGFELKLVDPLESNEKPSESGQWGTDETVVCVDEDGFDQIVINLVDNALKFAAGSNEKIIEFGYRFKKGKANQKKLVEFYIRDYGPGIPQDQIKKIFNMFYRLENELTRTTSGTGIGLALVQQLVEKMNAEAHVVNKNPGAEFKVSFEKHFVEENKKGS